MDFLNKLYESNYFGIGLFAVICFLVVTFLIVLFFGKKDEKKRKLEETRKLNLESNNQDAFKETTPVTPVELPTKEPIVEPVISTTPLEPIAPLDINQGSVKPQVITATEPVPETPIINEPVAPIISDDEPKENNDDVFVNNLNMDETPEVQPVVPTFEQPVQPIVEPLKPQEPVKPINNVEPITLESSKINYEEQPKAFDTIRINIPDEPVIKEEVKPIVTPSFTEPKPIIEEPTIQPSYYEPIKKEPIKEVSVPEIDFDAIAKSISKELDELENSTQKKYEEIKITPINEVTPPKPTNQFSSVYVGKPASTANKGPIDLPQKIDLPTRKNDDIEPESYNL